LYGSQTGTGQLFATKLGKKLKKKNFPTVVQNLGDYDETKATDENHMVLVVSCFGEGEPTHTAMKFWNWLMSTDRDNEKQKFEKLNYSLFGLGKIHFFVSCFLSSSMYRHSLSSCSDDSRQLRCYLI
jgi:sulfite reductase (NADPH) flavoprotein alpha-component